MLKDYLNKDAYITIVFSSVTIHGGSSIRYVKGKIVRYDNDFAEIEFDPTDKEQNSTYPKLSNTAGKMLVRLAYISTITLL